MDELKPCLLPCNLEQLNDRINNLSAGLTSMSSKDVMRVNKIFLTEVLNYMEELLGLRREEENRRATPENKPLMPEEFAPNIGCPVWCDWAGCWALMYLDANYEINLLYPDRSTEQFGKLISRMGPYGEKWHLYARKPEGSEKP